MSQVLMDLRRQIVDTRDEIFVHYVRENLAAGMEQINAINEAADRCIQEGILKELLEMNRNEVVTMLLSEYNEALHIQNEKNISYESGVDDVNELNNLLLAENRIDDLKRAAKDKNYQKQLFDELMPNRNK